MKTQITNKSTFAVVDLETSKAFDQGGKIIQIGITFVKNWQVVDSFATLVNPGHRIPKGIQELTGISDRDVRTAPYFEEISETVYSMLSDAVFVAHNVNFDLPFLNGELKRNHLQPLHVLAIDTVTLAQILLPTNDSYKLPDLATYFHIRLMRNHQADQDALTTAQLLIALKKTAERLPQPTLTLLQSINFNLLRQTQQFFSLVKGKPFDDDLFVKRTELVLSQCDDPVVINTDPPLHFPYNEIAQKKLFSNYLETRPAQGIMMKAVSAALEEPTPHKSLLIDVASGLGKTVGYLLPASLSATTESPIVIAASNQDHVNHVREELQTVILPMINRSLDVVTLGSFQDYIDIKRFEQRLHTPDNHALQLLKARIIVWLTITQNGAFSELKNGANPVLLAEFAAKNLNQNVNSTVFPNYFHMAVKQARQAAIVVTTHQGLVAANPLFASLGEKKNNTRLIIDNALQFAQLPDFDDKGFWGFRRAIGQKILSSYQMPVLVYQNNRTNPDHPTEIERVDTNSKTPEILRRIAAKANAQKLV